MNNNRLQKAMQTIYESQYHRPTDLDLYKEMLRDAEAELRFARQEAQQWEDETDLEVETLHDIIDGQQEHISTLARIIDKDQDLIMAKEAEIITRDREIADWKRSHSDVCEMNRRLCLNLQQAEIKLANWEKASEHMCKRDDQLMKEIADANREIETLRPWAFRTQRAEKESADARQANNNLLDQLQAAEAKMEYLHRHWPAAYWQAQLGTAPR